MALYYLVWMTFGFLSFRPGGFPVARDRVAPPGGAFPILLFAAFLLLSLRMNRNVADFALATLPGVAATFAGAFGRLVPRQGPGVRPRRPAPGPRRRFASSPPPWPRSLSGSRSRVIVHPVPAAFARARARTEIPVAAAGYLSGIGMRGNVFNSYASGAYLIDRLYPAVRVAMDSRNDVYGKSCTGCTPGR